MGRGIVEQKDMVRIGLRGGEGLHVSGKGRLAQAARHLKVSFARGGIDRPVEIEVREAMMMIRPLRFDAVQRDAPPLDRLETEATLIHRPHF